MEQDFVNLYFYTSLWFLLISLRGFYFMCIIASDSKTNAKSAQGFIILVLIYLIINNGYHTVKSYVSPKLTWEQRKSSWLYTDSTEKAN